MTLKVKIVVFSVLTPWSLVSGTDISEEHVASIFQVEYVSSRFFWNVDTHLPDYTASHPRRL
jgi:hypothetical protein